MEKEQVHYQFIETMKLLACDSDMQINALPSYVGVADEVALMYDDIYELALSKIALSKDSVESLKEINNVFNRIEEGQSWNNNTLKMSPEWQKIRQLAAQVLKNNGEHASLPNLSWIRFVE